MRTTRASSPDFVFTRNRSPVIPSIFQAAAVWRLRSVVFVSSQRARMGFTVSCTSIGGTTVFAAPATWNARATARMAVFMVLFALLRQNAFDLPHVIDVVPGEHSHDRLHGLLAPLGVHAVMLPLLWSKRFQQRHVRLAQAPVLLE